MALLNRKTIGLLVSAVVLTGGVLLFESSQSNNRSDDSLADTALEDSDKTQSELIFPFKEGDVERFSVTRSVVSDEADAIEGDAKTETLAFEKDESGDWRMTVPQSAVAEPGAIAFLLDRVTGMASQVLSVEADQLAEFGLDEPEATITLEAAGKSYEFLLGGVDFSGGKRYVRAIELDTTDSNATEPDEATADESDESIQVYLLGETITGGIERPLEEWLQSEDATETEDASDAEDASEPKEGPEVEDTSKTDEAPVEETESTEPPEIKDPS